MAGELATWQAKLPERSRYGIVQALRQTLAAAVRWDYMSRNPAKLAGRNSERKMSEADQQRAMDISTRMSECIAKAMTPTPGTP